MGSSIVGSFWLLWKFFTIIAHIFRRKVSPEDVGYDCKKFPQQPETSNNAGGGITSSVSKLQRPSSTGTSVSSGSGTNTTTDSDPLFNMLLHLQEAANNELTANNTN